MTEETSVLKILPNNGQRVLCFGFHTYCCKEDMDEKPDWHEVTFKLILSSYKLKKELPEDVEESILEFCNYIEKWESGDEFSDGMVIGVSKWKPLNLEACKKYPNAKIEISR